MVQRSMKLPLLLAVPVMLVLAAVAVFLLLPDQPPPPPTPDPAPLDNSGVAKPPDDGEDPLPAEIDPRPRPKPNNGAPESGSVADAMLAEAWGAMEDIRSRLELKYKYAKYKLDRTLTLETVLRRLSRLDGDYFKGTDYALSYPESEEDLVQIECLTIEGRDLPDGPLTMTVEMRTGESTTEGTIFARNAEGYVVLGDSAYRALTVIMRESILDHFNVQNGYTEGLADLVALTPNEVPEPFSTDDFKASSSGAMGYRLSCATVDGEGLAQPVVVTADYDVNTISITSIPSDDWMRPPDDRERLKNRIDWLLQDMARNALNQLEREIKAEDIRIYTLGASWWYFRWAELSPFDVKLEITPGDSPKVTLTVATSFGKPLPFKPVRFVAIDAESKGSYID